jgi:hypothetical protein
MPALCGAGVKIGAPQKNFWGLQTKMGQKLCPPTLKRRPLTKIVRPFGRGRGVQTVVFWSNLHPSFYAITGHGPAGPPVATALILTLLYFNSV